MVLWPWMQVASGDADGNLFIFTSDSPEAPTLVLKVPVRRVFLYPYTLPHLLRHFPSLFAHFPTSSLRTHRLQISGIDVGSNRPTCR